MRKLVAAINMTLDGYCDHTVMIADDELHQHYAELINKAGALLYGRKTYELMKYWQSLLKNPSGNKAMDEFAQVIDGIPKIVFSHTLKSPDWKSATLATKAQHWLQKAFKKKFRTEAAGGEGHFSRQSGFNCCLYSIGHDRRISTLCSSCYRWQRFAVI